jgi:acyl-CoA thioester hydrolase
VPTPDSDSRAAHPPARSRFAQRSSPAAASSTSASLLSQQIRIYLEDTDAGGIVYHASWLRFFERARTDWLRALGIEQSSLGPSSGISFVVRDLQIEFLRPGRLDQVIRTELRLQSLRGASLGLLQQAFDDATNTELARATVRIAALRLADQRAAPLPRKLLENIASICEGPGEP